MKIAGIKISRSWIAVALGLSFLAFNQPQKGDLVELSAWLAGRSSSYFRASDNNRIKNYGPGTRGLVKKVKYFPRTGNYGICIDVIDGKADANCTWIYYNKNRPNMQLISVAKDKSNRDATLIEWQRRGSTTTDMQLATSPETADAARTTQDVEGIKDTPVIETPVPERQAPIADTSSDAGTDNDQTAKTVVENIDRANSHVAAVMVATPKVCVECAAPKLESFPGCTARNSYQESTIKDILDGAKFASVFQGSQKEIIRSSCIQRSLDTAPSSAKYRKCGGPAGISAVGKACTSENYVDLTAKSFNVVANCLAEYVSGSKATKAEASLMIFSLMAHESGLQTNIVSGTGAGGPGQMTGAAIGAVNRELPNIVNYLKSSDNPQCSQALAKVLENPMSASSRTTCERLSLEKDNPIKNMIYTFGLQALTRRYVEDLFDNRVFSSLLTQDLPAVERERLMSSLAAWSHNTGTGGMNTPLKVLLAGYLRNGKKVSDAADVSQLLKDLAVKMRTNPDRRNSRRLSETSGFFNKITNRMSQITSEPSSCLAN